MQLLSIDVGIKNLAFCLFEQNGESQTILDWDVVNISESELVFCKFVDKKGLCDKPAKYKKDKQCFCLKHAKKEDCPTIKSSYIKKQKIGRLRELADKYHIPNDKSAKKCELVALVDDYMKLNSLQEIHVANASKIDLVSIGHTLKKKFDTIFASRAIDCVIIENQISPIASRMKTIQGMIAQYFIMKGVDKIEFVSASNKLKDCVKTSNYKERKRLGIQQCIEQLSANYVDQIEYFDTHKKQDDLADSFLQGVWYITEKYTNTYS
jgi:hypothetical protein